MCGKREGSRGTSTSDRGTLGDRELTTKSWLCNVQLQLSLSEQLYKINRNISLREENLQSASTCTVSELFIGILHSHNTELNELHDLQAVNGVLPWSPNVR